MLALANKITHDPVPEISNKYPKQMHQLICVLLEKDPSKRPAPRDIIEDKYVRMYMASFSELEESQAQPENKEKPNRQQHIQEYSN